MTENPHSPDPDNQGPDNPAHDNPGQPQQPSSVPPAQPAYQPAPAKRLVRRSDDRMIAGVCSGLAAYFGIDTTLVRVLAVLGAVFGFGSIVIVYLVLWAVMPEA